MARIPYVQAENAPAEVKELYDSFTQQMSIPQVPNVVKALANSPKLARRVFPLAAYFMRESALDPRLRELAVLILMKRLNCNYGFVRHIEIAEQTGLSREQIDNIGSYQTSPLFTDDDKLIIRYAEELTLKAQVDDELFRQVKERIGQQHILDLTAATAFWNMMARNLNALQVDLEAKPSDMGRHKACPYEKNRRRNYGARDLELIDHAHADVLELRHLLDYAESLLNRNRLCHQSLGRDLLARYHA